MENERLSLLDNIGRYIIIIFMHTIMATESLARFLIANLEWEGLPSTDCV